MTAMTLIQNAFISGVGIWFSLAAGIMIAINWLLMPCNEL